MKVVILSDNNPHPTLCLPTEHGLSVYFEADGYKWLMDTGASEQYYHNAVSLGIRIEDIDFLVLSHGHSDHTGGVEHFIRHNPKAQIIMSSHIRGTGFYSCRLPVKRNIGMNQEVVEQHIHRFVLVEHNRNLTDTVAFLCDIPQVYPAPRANATLTQFDVSGERPDEFRHEAALAVKTPEGLVVVSGCCHQGVLNILGACADYYPGTSVIACVGGTHLVDGDKYETDAEICEIGNTLRTQYPQLRLITGHCTGIHAQQQLSCVMGEAFQTFHTGERFGI